MLSPPGKPRPITRAIQGGGRAAGIAAVLGLFLPGKERNRQLHAERAAECTPVETL